MDSLSLLWTAARHRTSFRSLKEAVAAARDGDRILLLAGVHNGMGCAAPTRLLRFVSVALGQASCVATAASRQSRAAQKHACLHSRHPCIWISMLTSHQACSGCVDILSSLCEALLATLQMPNER